MKKIIYLSNNEHFMTCTEDVQIKEYKSDKESLFGLIKDRIIYCSYFSKTPILNINKQCHPYGVYTTIYKTNGWKIHFYKKGTSTRCWINGLTSDIFIQYNDANIFFDYMNKYFPEDVEFFYLIYNFFAKENYI